MGKAPCCDKANVKKGPWSPEEDCKLKEYIDNHGIGGNWLALPQKVGLKRCGKSCRLRWLNYLRPNLKHGGFSEEENNIICSLFISIGRRWSIIAAQMPGRTDNDIKNYWNTRLKKKLLGRFRDHHKTRLAAAKQESKDMQIYYTAEAITSPNIYRPQKNQQMNIDMDAYYSNLGPGIIPSQMFKQNCGLAATASNSNSESATFWLDLQQAQLDQKLFDHNSCLTKPLQRTEGALVDHRSDNCKTAISNSYPIQASNCINPSEIPHSNAHDQYNLDAASLQIFYETAASPVLMYERHIDNPTRLGNPAASLAQNDNSLVFSPSSSRPEGGNYESAWMNTFSAENNNFGSYGFSSELNDLLL